MSKGSETKQAPYLEDAGLCTWTNRLSGGGFLFHSPAFDALRAHAHMLGSTSDHHVDALEVRLEEPFTPVVRVADRITPLEAFAAKFALIRHE